MRKLEILNTKLKGKTMVLKEITLVGSGEGCQVRARHDSLASQHARFFRDTGGRQMVELLDRSHHLYVNGHDVARSELRTGDQIRVGPLKFRYTEEVRRPSSESRLDNLIEEYERQAEQHVYDFAKEDLFYLVTRHSELRRAIAFRIPSRDRFIDQAQAFVSRIAVQAGMDQMKHEALMTCCKELILNAHRHGHDYDESKSIVVRYFDKGDRIELVIEDQGAGFDHQALLDSVRNVDAATAARERYKAGGFGGLGFQLITKMAERLEYNEAGNVVTFQVTKEF
jgi:anti-sigma regulatory factor (Ser/Thr protein kinase)